MAGKAPGPGNRPFVTVTGVVSDSDAPTLAVTVNFIDVDGSEKHRIGT